MTRLVTERASRAEADQRRGRAGRTQPGVCYRLWAEAATGALEPFTRPEILSADLAGLVLDHLGGNGSRGRDGAPLRASLLDAEARARMLTAEDIARTACFVLDSPAHVRIDELVVSPVSQA